MPAPLKVKKLSKVYTQANVQVVALSDIDITLKQEECVVIIGPNGCGKSTLLKLIAGIEKPTSGTITTSSLPAYLPQAPSLLPWRTVEQNLLLPYDVQKTTPKPNQTDTLQLLKDFGLLEFRSFYPAALSGGMQQKVALLRSVASSPSVLLLDEPFASLDAITRLELQRWLLDLKRRTRSSLVCVTHDIQEAIYLADTIYVLSERPGRLKQKFSTSGRLSDHRALEAKLRTLLVGSS